jgi:SAM-dependent methyltransferase
MSDACRKYHDHVASIYDDIYGRSPYWKFYHELSWDHMKPFLPRDLSFEVHDVGCGTGLYGLRLLKAGYRVVFSDTSPKMLNVARRKVEEAGFGDRAEFMQLCASDMGALQDGRFGLICAQGDPLSLCPDPKRAFREVARTLRPGCAAIVSLDNRAAGYEHFLEKEDLDGAVKFHRDGVLTWLAEKADERFPFFTFEPRDVERMAAAAGLEVASLIGKCVLPVRKFPALLEQGAAYRALLKIEKKLASRRSNLGRAAHLQAALRKSG